MIWMMPAYRMIITNSSLEILKDYSESGVYIDDIEVNERDNLITIKRLTKKAGEEIAFGPAEDDTIMNRYVEIKKPVSVTRRVTDRTLTEYYISIPDNIDIVEVPAYAKAQVAVINYDTTARITEPADREGIFYSYCYGEVMNTSLETADTIRMADVNVGTVINREGRIIWERGIKAARASISGITAVRADGELDSVRAAMKMLLMYKNLDTDLTGFDIRNETVRDRLQTRTRSVILDLTGSSLDEVLYYVYKSRPVIGFKADGSAVVITAYDAVSVTVYEPAKDKTVKYSVHDAEVMFEAGGNRFVSYAE